MVKITDLIVDPKSLGNKFWLTEVAPVYDYKDNKRTETILGYRYTVCLPECGLEKIAVKIDGKQLLESPESGYVEVQFQNLEVFIYWYKQEFTVGAKATDISLAKKG